MNEETEQTQIELGTMTYDFVGGSISLVPYKKWEINGKIAETQTHIKIVGVNANGKPVEARILTKNAFDSILRILKSRKGLEFREYLASSNTLDSIES